MDLNLHLLESDQLSLIQDICLTTGKIDNHIFNGFLEVRDKIDLIILPDSNMIEEDLKYEEKEIQEKIRKEKQLWGDREFPKLPNYDDPENPEPIWLPIDYHPSTDLLHKKPVTRYIDWKPGQGRRPSISSTIEYITEDIERAPAGSMTKYQLLLLDASLARIKWDRLRLISKTITGRYAVSKNRKMKRVYLFPDAIKKVALSYGVDVNCVLAGTFIHEMFHAYFDNTKAKGFIYRYLKRIVEIEEAVTECSTLLFIRQNYPSYLTFTEKRIKNKFDHGNPALYCYGVGYYLYQQLISDKTIKNIFNKYRKIQRAPRLSVPEVRDYICEVRGSSPAAHKCVNYIVLIVNYFNKFVGADMKHYEFDGKRYGWEIQLVRDVLEYYVAKHKPTLAQIQADFRTSVNHDFFEEVSAVKALGKEKEYNFDIQLTLSCGSVIIPRKAWKNTNERDNTPRFINEVRMMYHSPAKKIDSEINVLR